ncbi:MAG: hypothetical protein RLP44_15825 [Aggregatilineales bacterium]
MRFVLIGFALMFTVSLSAQMDSCLALYRASLVNGALECDDLAVDTLCYGNLGLSAELTADAPTVPFSFAGDVVNVVDVATLESLPLDLEAGDYGVAVSRLGVSGTEVASWVIFGDVDITNNSVGLLTFAVRVTFADGIFARSAPTTDANIIQPLAVGQQILASGRLDDSSWLRVILPGDEVAWVSADLVAPVDETMAFASLAVTEDTPQTLALPLRDLTIVSSMDESPCAGVPESGLLVQSPQDEPLVLRINGRTLSLDGTAFVQAQDEDSLTVSVMDGTANIILNENADITLVGGERYESGAELPIISYDYDRVEALPYELLEYDVLIASDWLTALIPESDQPLAGSTTESLCTIAVGEAVTVRVGPGTDYQRRGSLLAGQSANPTGRAFGSNGRVWWRIAGGAWVANDVVVIGGDCNVVPQVEVAPRVR